MTVTYIHHSGFLVETAARYYLFDYYDGALPALDARKPVVVLSSHGHADHYNPAVFGLLRERGMQIQAVLAKDIPARKYADGVDVLKAYANQTYTLDGGTVIRTLLSTDAGVAYVIEDPEGVLYHAGDLNDWYWEGEPEQENRQMTGSYRHEIRKLSEVDVAFVVLDPRQEAHYADGMLYFLQHVRCGCVFPMHYWDEPQTIARFLSAYPQYQDIIQNTEQTIGREIKCSLK